MDEIEADCPRCGCNDVEVMEWPAVGPSWFGSGKARCNHCGTEFAIKYEETPGCE